jgi:zinc protease
MRATALSIRTLAAAAALAALGGRAGAQTLDRTAAPTAGPPPALQVPAWTTTTLSNGAQLVVAERHTLPLVSFSIGFAGGTSQYETADKRGVADLTVAMLQEGTATRSGDALSNAWQLLGTQVYGGVGSEQGFVAFESTRQRFPAALALLEDMLVNPAFPADALERIRGRTLVGLQQARDQPRVIGSQVFPRVLYGAAHPYGTYATEQTVRGITRDDVARFAQAYLRPSHAVITVVGDVNANEVKALIERTLAPWTGQAVRPVFDYPSVPTSGATTIYLVDKPGAAQSSFWLGLPGPARSTPDYYALQVMNTILGGFFQSRLNANIREQHGYSYGVSSSFAFGKGPGPFRAGGEVVTAKSDSALIEFMRELRGALGERPFTQAELDVAKAARIQSLPERFSTTEGVNGTIRDLYVQGIEPDFYQSYARNIDAVTLEDLSRVARRYVDLNHLAIVIVGDRSRIEAPLRATGIAPVTILDVNGVPAT